MAEFTKILWISVKLIIFLLLILVAAVCIGIIVDTVLHWIHPEDPISCNCNCSNDVYCQVDTPMPKQGYVHDNIVGAHSNFDTQEFLAASEEYGTFFGYSMEPSLYEGNTLLLKNMTSQYHLDPGEIIRYTTISYPNCKSKVPLHKESPYVIHRIKAIYGDDIYTQGDNLHDIEVISRCQITHVVIGVLYT